MFLSHDPGPPLTSSMNKRRKGRGRQPQLPEDPVGTSEEDGEDGRKGSPGGKDKQGRDGDKNPGRSLPGKGIRGELPREALLELKAPSEDIPKEGQEERKTSSR